MIRFSIRDLLWLTVVVALGVSGCFGRSGDDDEIQYFPPGPEFKKSEGAATDSLPNPSGSLLNPPTE